MSAEPEQRRKPGSQLLRIATNNFDQYTSEMMLKPIIADLQHEYRDESSRKVSKLFVLLRGYLSFWKAIGFYGLTIREANMRIAKRVVLNVLTLALSGLIIYPVILRTGIFDNPEVRLQGLRRGGRVVFESSPVIMSGWTSLILLLAGLAGLVIALTLGARVVSFLMAAFLIYSITLVLTMTGTIGLRYAQIAPLAALLGVVLGAAISLYGSKCSLKLFTNKHGESTGNLNKLP
jgi:hypothetical protein